MTNARYVAGVGGLFLNFRGIESVDQNIDACNSPAPAGVPKS